MADGANLKFPWKQYQRMLKQLGEAATGRAMKIAMARTGDLYEAEAVKLAPHDSGYLENNTSVKTRALYGTGITTVIMFHANYAAEVHELPPARRGQQTRAKPSTKFGVAGPKYLERVLVGMDFEYHLGNEFRAVLRNIARNSKKRRRR